MKIIHNEFNEFLQLLIKEKVEFLLIGGFAVAFHGYVRYTGDMDVWINATPENASKLIRQFIPLVLKQMNYSTWILQKNLLFFTWVKSL